MLIWTELLKNFKITVPLTNQLYAQFSPPLSPTVSYYNNYMALGMSPSPDTTSDPPFVFVQKPIVLVNREQDVYEESLDYNNTYSFNQIRDYSINEIFKNLVNIFREVPFVVIN